MFSRNSRLPASQDDQRRGRDRRSLHSSQVVSMTSCQGSLESFDLLCALLMRALRFRYLSSEEPFAELCKKCSISLWPAMQRIHKQAYHSKGPCRCPDQHRSPEREWSVCGRQLHNIRPRWQCSCHGACVNLPRQKNIHMFVVAHVRCADNLARAAQDHLQHVMDQLALTVTLTVTLFCRDRGTQRLTPSGRRRQRPSVSNEQALLLSICSCCHSISQPGDELPCMLSKRWRVLPLERDLAGSPSSYHLCGIVTQH